METKWWIAIGVGVAAALAGAVYYEEKKSKALAAPKCPAGQSLVNGKCVKIVGVVQKGHPGAPIKQPTQIELELRARSDQPQPDQLRGVPRRLPGDLAQGAVW